MDALLHLRKDGVDTPIKLKVSVQVETVGADKVTIANPPESVAEVTDLNGLIQGIDTTTLASVEYVQQAIRQALSGITFTIENGDLKATYPETVAVTEKTE